MVVISQNSNMCFSDYLSVILVIVLITLSNSVNGSLTLDQMLLTSFSDLGACKFNEPYHDRTLGYIDANATYYCDQSTPTTMRQKPGITCCTPMTPEHMMVRFRLFKPGQGEVGDLDWRSVSDSDRLDPERRVVFITHGYLENPEISTFMYPMTDGFLTNGDQVVIIDWRHSNSIQYFQSVANLRVIGAMVGHMIVTLDIADRTLFVGFSLGAQMMGEAGRFVKNHNQLINECLGLDPAGAGFDGGHEGIRLTKSDCRVVQVIHTGSSSTLSSVVGFLSLQLGTYHKCGHCDFWVNCGHGQPKCNLDIDGLVHGLKDILTDHDISKLFTWLGSRVCSHTRAAEVAKSSLLGLCDYQTEKCHSPWCGEGPWTTWSCSGTGSPGLQLPPLANGCSPDHDANYILRTSDFSPWCNPRHHGHRFG